MRVGPNQPRVLMCVPVYSGMEPQPFWHFMRMQRHHTLMESIGLYKAKVISPGPKMKIQYVRNMTVAEAIRIDATHVFFVDDDFLCPEDTLTRLLMHNVDIVGGLFFRGGEPFDPLIFTWQDLKDGRGRNLYSPNAWEPNTLMEVDGIGTGCVLIKTEVFHKVRPPYFYFPEAQYDRTMDLQFCVRAQQRGCKIYCDTSIVCKQMGLPTVIGEEQFLEYQAKKGGFSDVQVPTETANATPV